MQKKYYDEKPGKNAIVDEADVLVTGGGPAGIGAALGAAKAGARVVLVERNGCLGGTGTAGMMEFYGSIAYEHSHGVLQEIYDRLKKMGALRMNKNNTGVFIDCEIMKYVALQLMEENHVNLKLYSLSSKPIMEDSRVKGIIFEGKSGREAILCNHLVDCTGDADMAFASGVPCQTGREGDEKTRPMALLFRVGNIDYPKLERYVRENPDQFAPSKSVSVLDMDNQVIRLFGFYDIVEKARKKGEIDSDLYYIRFEGLTKGNTGILNTTRIYHVDGSDTDDLTSATLTGYKQIFQLVDVLKKYVPGFENVELINIAPNMGVRQSRRIAGEYVYDITDIEKGTYFHDTVCTVHRYGQPGQEHHSPDGEEGKDRHVINKGSANILRKYNVPYRTILPVGVDNLLVAGRCFSATHLGGIWMRSMPNCILLGQAAGTAAAIASKNNIIPRNIDIPELQSTLRKQNVKLDG